MRLRHTPELVFLLDKSMERGQRIERILRELNDEETAEHEFTDEQS
jgi:ribosome-binding factor A